MEFDALHLSDLHLGGLDEWNRGDRLLRSIKAAISQLQESNSFALRWLFFTGDLASKGTAEQLSAAVSFLRDLATQLGIAADRIVICPGNHDVDWRETQEREKENQDRSKWRAQHFAHYVGAVRPFYEKAQHPSLLRSLPELHNLGEAADVFTLHHWPEDDVLVISFNSCIVESHRSEDHYGYVGQDQIDRVTEILDRLRSGDRPKWDQTYRIAMIHHPFFAPYDKDPSALRDPIYLMNWLRDYHVHLVLHGHQHWSQIGAVYGDRQGFLTVGAASVGVHGSARPEPLGFNLLRLGITDARPWVKVVRAEFRRMANKWDLELKNTTELILNVGVNGVGESHSNCEFRRKVGLEGTWEQLAEAQRQIADERPVYIEGRNPALRAYLQALERTEKRFLVTSFLHSEFWGSPMSDEIVEENRRLALKISAKSNRKPRRLFVIEARPQTYVLGLVQQAYSRRAAGDPVFWERLQTIKANLRQLLEFFEMKVINVTESLRREISTEFDPRRYELAIYDDWRIDRFTVSRNGEIAGVLISAGKAVNKDLVRQLDKFLDDSWNSSEAVDVGEYIKMVDEEMSRIEKAIQYTPDWINRFDQLVQLGKNSVLANEARLVVKILEKLLKSRELSRFEQYLDVGVCTARYPVLLGQEKKLVGQCSGLDIDADVQGFMTDHHSTIDFYLGDIRDPSVKKILPGGYDLITCMLGTACHFGLNSDPHWDGRSGFEAAIENMLDLLAPSGLLILSVWRVRGTRKYLDIYDEPEKAKLRKGTPTEQEVKQICEKLKAKVGPPSRTAELRICAITRD
jgi:3',5'-cyclic AMP phosphodiesterase CpdA/SAM-dependent methyltransferase